MNDRLSLTKYQSIGNDYLFLNAANFPVPSKERIRQICHRHFGIGSDGLLYGGYINNHFKLTVFNPDASIAEISGNGSRIFARAMYDLGMVEIGQRFEILTNFYTVQCHLISASDAAINMGMPVFDAPNIPKFQETGISIYVNDRNYRYYPVSVGNPHCVIFVDEITEEHVIADGPVLEKNTAFPEKTNIEFARIVDANNIKIAIWERGAGYTLSSGSGACAAFAIARKLNLCSPQRTIAHMFGGRLALTEDPVGGSIIQSGPVSKIAECYLS